MFTSRLPISTSARRPTNPRDGSTSFVAQNRPSNVPVTVQKANLFTPKTSKRPFMAGTSTVGKSHMSVMTSDKKNYQRPLKPVPDRDMQIKMFETLVDYLKTNAPHLPLPEAKKFFSSISTTESSRIFEFLISRLLPEFKLNKLETDVPEALALLKYPYIRSVTKSALVSVTTRQASVGLLVIFHWLIGFIKQMEPLTWEEVNNNGALLDEKRQIYRIILANPPERQPEECRKLFDKLYPAPDYHGVMKALEDTKEEIAVLERNLAEIQDLEEEVAFLDRDLELVADYQLKMEEYVHGLKDKKDDLGQQALNLEAENKERLKRNEHLRNQIEKHEFTEEDVVKNQETLARLESELDDINRKLHASNNENQKAEEDFQMILTRFVEMRIKNINQLNKLRETYRSQDFGSKLWAERRLELEALLSRFERTPHDDLEQNFRLQREQEMLLQKSSATDGLLESEVRDGLTERRLELENFEASNEKRSNNILRLEETLRRREREVEDEVCRDEEALNNLRAENQELDAKIEVMEAKRKAEEAALAKGRDMQRRELEQDRKEFNTEIDLSRKRMESALARIGNQANTLVEEAESEARQAQEARKIVRENYEISKKFCKFLDKHL